MTDLPAAAIEAATWALHSRPHGTINGPCACDSADEHGIFLAEDEAAATAALEAAAPLIAAAERERLTADLEPAITRQLDPLFAALGDLLQVVADECPLTDAVMAAADKVRVAMVALGMRDIGSPPA